MDPQHRTIPEAGAYRILEMALRDLQAAARILGNLEARAPDPERAGHVEALHAAIAELQRVVPSPFVLAGEVTSWDPDTRVLYIGDTRLEVTPGVAAETLVPKQSVTVSGYRSKDTAGPWVVTEIRVHRAGS
jgi:hypothetical protein